MSENEQVVLRSESLSLKQVTDRVNHVHEVLNRVMKKGTHYGTVPGCGDKMVLLKPGADVLAMTFRLVPEFEIVTANLPNDHREFAVTCSMRSPDGTLLGQGVGSASTMEKKYRYRYEGGTWDPKAGKKVGGTRIENEDIADVYNTVLKIAKKRSHIDATLTVTGAADLFTQDMIDEDEPLPRKPVGMPVEKKESAPAGQPCISEAQGKRLYAICHKAGVTMETLKKYLLEVHKIEHSNDMPRSIYDRVCAWSENGGQDTVTE